MFSSGFRKSFSFRLFRYFAGIILMIALPFTLAVIYYQKTAMTSDLVREGKLISVVLTSSLKPWIFAENTEMLKNSLKDVMLLGHIDSVTIFNFRGEIVYKGERKATKPSADQVPDFKGIRFDDSDGGRFYVSEVKETIDIICPVKMDSPDSSGQSIYFESPAGPKAEVTIGYLRVGITKDTIRKEVHRIIIRIAIAALLGILAGFSVLFIGASIVTNPLKELIEHLRHFGYGEKVERIPVTSDDEIGRLAEAFNTMSDNLRTREEEKQALQDRLKKSEKLEAVGRLARGIAHDFNNILSTVQGSVYLLEKKFGDHEKVMDYTVQIRNSLSRARALIENIIIFSKAGTIKGWPVELNSVLKRLAPALRTVSGEAITLDMSLAADDLVVLGDVVQIEQLIMNLAGNAVDAMPVGGVLSIRTERRIVADEHAAVNHDLRSGRSVCLLVADTGTGMDEGTKDKIFEPFFTTKQAGMGTGLGLSIVYGIVEQHRGHIELKSEQGQGTEFRIYLPLFEKNGETHDNIQ
jgi:signal transduction histidine kinase